MSACAAPRLRHLEWFHDHVRIEHMLFDGAPVPRDGMIAPDLSRPGSASTFKQRDAERFRVRECRDDRAIQRRARRRRWRAPLLGAAGASCSSRVTRCGRRRPRRRVDTTARCRARRAAQPRGAALLAAVRALDSAVEHYRGSFHNKTM